MLLKELSPQKTLTEATKIEAKNISDDDIKKLSPEQVVDLLTFSEGGFVADWEEAEIKNAIAKDMFGFYKQETNLQKSPRPFTHFIFYRPIYKAFNSQDLFTCGSITVYVGNEANAGLLCADLDCLENHELPPDFEDENEAIKFFRRLKIKNRT